MKLTMLGTGNALVTEYYNTCFVISDKNQHFMVDGGGGNRVLHQLSHCGFNISDIRNIFVTHKHIDHLLGIIWLIRIICKAMNNEKYIGNAYIYGHDEVIDLLRDISTKLLFEKERKYLDKRLLLVKVKDREKVNIIGCEVTFFDIHSDKAKQFGFSMKLDQENLLTCCGDEPYNDSYKDFALNSKWLLHEAFCLHSEADIFKPYQKHHSTVKDACQTAEKLNIKNLVLYHTEDKNKNNRKQLYLEEGRQFYSGNLFIPEDFESLEL